MNFARSQFSGTLNFVGSIASGFFHALGFLASISFSGIHTKQINKRFPTTGTLRLSFVGSFKKQTLRRLVAATLNFIGSISGGFEHFIEFLASLSFSAIHAKRAKKSILANLHFIGSIPAKFYNAAITIFIRASIKSAIAFGFNVNIISQNDAVTAAGQSTQYFTTTPSLVNIGGVGRVFMIFIKNQDNTYPIEIDSSASFDAFPQRISPGQAIILCPETNAIYGRSTSGIVQSIIVAMGRG